MMVRIEPHHAANGHESLYGLVTACATAARPRILVILTVLSASAALALFLFSNAAWPVAMYFFATATICLWGIVEQTARKPMSRALALLEMLLVVFGCAATLAGSLGVLLWILGPAPVL
jgi:hypothetical protein